MCTYKSSSFNWTIMTTNGFDTRQRSTFSQFSETSWGKSFIVRYVIGWWLWSFSEPSTYSSVIAQSRSIENDEKHPTTRRSVLFSYNKQTHKCYILGALLTTWMECYIQEYVLNNPPSSYPQISSRLNGKSWSDIPQDRCNEFCISKPISPVRIFTHHLVLRSVLGRRHLPVLSTYKNHKHGDYTFFDWPFNLSLFIISVSSMRYNGLHIKRPSVHWICTL